MTYPERLKSSVQDSSSERFTANTVSSPPSSEITAAVFINGISFFPMFCMKKIVSCICAAAMALSLSACSKKEPDTRPLGEMRGISAAELIAEMGTGWNLGNTMDSEEGGETGWGNPIQSVS